MYPYGKSYPAAANYTATEDYDYGYNGMEKAKEVDDNANHTHFRNLDLDFVRWWSRDPAERKFVSFSAYVVNGNNPLNFIDPRGDDWVEGTNGDITWREEITSQDDLGEDSEEIYRGTEYIRFENIGDENFDEVRYSEDRTITSKERARPDNDGIITNEEALEWWHYAGGAPLTIDIGLLDFKSSKLSVEDFRKRNTNTLSVNFFRPFDYHLFNSDIIYRPARSEPLSHVFGTIRLQLLDANTGEIRLITNDETGAIDRYNFRYLGFVAEWQFNNGSPTDYNIFGIGTGKIKLKKPKIEIPTIPRGPKH
jgi:RHS repeat-associated protein